MSEELLAVVGPLSLLCFSIALPIEETIGHISRCGVPQTGQSHAGSCRFVQCVRDVIHAI